MFRHDNYILPCEWASRIHTGNDCQPLFYPIERDPCDSSPCKNGGTCTKVTFKVFNCTCAKGYTGPSCAQGKKLFKGFFFATSKVAYITNCSGQTFICSLNV